MHNQKKAEEWILYRKEEKVKTKVLWLLWKRYPRHQRSPHATKFEDRSHEETDRQERCAQSKAWDLAKKKKYKLKVNDKATFFSPAEKWVFQVPQQERRECL